MKTIDLKEEVYSLFKKEDTIAFFDFQILLDTEEPVSGLCKISRPKKSTSELNYLSLMFIIDTPNDHAWRHVNNSIKEFSKGTLDKELSEIQYTVSVPSVNVGQENFIKDYEIILKKHILPDKNFISRKLVPVIRSGLNIKNEEIMWWDDLLTEKEELLKSDMSEESANKSIFDKIMAFLT